MVIIDGSDSPNKAHWQSPVWWSRGCRGRSLHRELMSLDDELAPSSDPPSPNPGRRRLRSVSNVRTPIDSVDTALSRESSEGAEASLSSRSRRKSSQETKSSRPVPMTPLQREQLEAQNMQRRRRRISSEMSGALIHPRTSITPSLPSTPRPNHFQAVPVVYSSTGRSIIPIPAI